MDATALNSLLHAINPLQLESLPLVQLCSDAIQAQSKSACTLSLLNSRAVLAVADNTTSNVDDIRSIDSSTRSSQVIGYHPVRSLSSVGSTLTVESGGIDHVSVPRWFMARDVAR